MPPPALPEAFLAAIPLVVGRELAQRVWAVWEELTALYPYDLPPCLAGPAEEGLYVLGWPLPDGDLQVWITLDGLSWDFTRAGEFVAMGESLRTAPADTPEALYPFSRFMAEVIEEHRQLLKALPPDAQLQ